MSISTYPDGRPTAKLRLDAKDHGIVLKHGDGPNRCDFYGARDIWVYEDNGTYYMHYDAAGDTAWLCALATSSDGIHWQKRGAVLDLGTPGTDDSKSASYGVTYHDGDTWHLFYLGTPNTTEPPDRIPAFPYLTKKGWSTSPSGPWHKQPEVTPFRCEPNTYYSVTASPGYIVKQDDEYLQFFSAATMRGSEILRTLSIARTRDLNGPWQVDPQPIFPLEEQVENSSLYFEPSNDTWFLFTNHVGIDSNPAVATPPQNNAEYTDAVWMYWSKDLNHWDTNNKAVVLDRDNCGWSPCVMGLPSVIKIGNRLAIFYDGYNGMNYGHMGRDVGLAWLDLPLTPVR